MAGKNCADIVFCLDASGSMQPCIDALRRQIGELIKGLENDGQTSWDVRYDFLAFHDSESGVHWYRSVHLPTCPLIDSIYNEPLPGVFFTRDLNVFKSALNDIKLTGEEMQLLALDIAVDYPWRSSSDCHRVVVLLSDEAVETGVHVPYQVDKLDALIKKIMDKRIKLFVIAPESEAFYRLSEADRCEYTALESDRNGLREVDFSKMLQTIGKSVSVSQSYTGAPVDARPLFNQKEWTTTSGTDFGTDRT